MELYLGIDIGTTHIKVCAADTNGRVVKTALRDQESRPVPGWGNCISPEELWDKTAACLEEVLSETEPGAVKGIGITSMAEAGVPVDRRRRPALGRVRRPSSRRAAGNGGAPGPAHLVSAAGPLRACGGCG